ncbi:MAG: contractile injection system protein, VgrG/Pvc8 family [Myxococcales bacterium]
MAGSPLDVAKQARLTRIVVDLHVEMFGQCELLFNDPDLALTNSSDFASGTRVKVELGFSSSLTCVFEGEVVALEPQFRRDVPPSLRVICYETLHRLALSQMTRAFNDVDDKEIATKIAQEHGLTADAPAGTKEHVLQGNVTDAAFLRRIAQKHGNQLRLEGTKIVIGPKQGGGAIPISSADGLRKMRVRIKSQKQVGEVTVHAWDPKAKQEIVASAKPQGDVGEGARQYGGQRTIALSGSDTQAPDTASAETIAKARMQRIAEGFVTAELEMIGDPRALPGASIELDKIDPPTDGTWRVERSRHEWSRHGYYMWLQLVRTAKKKLPAPVKGPKEQPATTWLEIVLLDDAGNPVAGQQYQVQTADGRTLSGRLDAEGKARLEGLKPGNNQVSFPGYSNQWQRK